MSAGGQQDCRRALVLRVHGHCRWHVADSTEPRPALSPSDLHHQGNRLSGAVDFLSISISSFYLAKIAYLSICSDSVDCRTRAGQCGAVPPCDFAPPPSCQFVRECEARLVEDYKGDYLYTHVRVSHFTMPCPCPTPIPYCTPTSCHAPAPLPLHATPLPHPSHFTPLLHVFSLVFTS